MPYKEFSNLEYVITADELKERLNETVLIDVRPAEEYAAGPPLKARLTSICMELVSTTPRQSPWKPFFPLFHHQFEFRGITNENAGCRLRPRDRRARRARRLVACGAQSSQRQTVGRRCPGMDRRR